MRTSCRGRIPITDPTVTLEFSKLLVLYNKTVLRCHRSTQREEETTNVPCQIRTKEETNDSTGRQFTTRNVSDATIASEFEIEVVVTTVYASFARFQENAMNSYLQYGKQRTLSAYSTTLVSVRYSSSRSSSTVRHLQRLWNNWFPIWHTTTGVFETTKTPNTTFFFC